MYSINFTVTREKFCLSLHYNGANSYLFVNGTEIYKFKAKDSEIVASPLCLGNISKDWSTDNMKKAGFNGYVYDFSVDYDATDVDDILDIHKYLMKKNNIGKWKYLDVIFKRFLYDQQFYQVSQTQILWMQFHWVVFQWTIKSVKQHHKLLILMEMSRCFFHLVLKKLNVVVVVIIWTICMQKCVFLML